MSELQQVEAWMYFHPVSQKKHLEARRYRANYPAKFGWVETPLGAVPVQTGALTALRLARPIVEADLADACDHCDADWEGMSRTALEAIDAALAKAGAGHA